MRPLWRVLVSRSRVAGLTERLALGREVDVRHVGVDNVRVVDREDYFKEHLVKPVSWFGSVVLQPRSQMSWDSTPEHLRFDDIYSQC